MPRWSGHTEKMENERLPKVILIGELTAVLSRRPVRKIQGLPEEDSEKLQHRLKQP